MRLIDDPFADLLSLGFRDEVAHGRVDAQGHFRPIPGGTGQPSQAGGGRKSILGSTNDGDGARRDQRKDHGGIEESRDALGGRSLAEAHVAGAFDRNRRVFIGAEIALLMSEHPGGEPFPIKKLPERVQGQGLVMTDADWSFLMSVPACSR